MRNKNSINKILKTDDNKAIKIENSKEYKNTKSQMRSICKALTLPTKDYRPDITVESIQEYLDKKDKLNRILYSEISSYYFGLGNEDRGRFFTNIENLLNFSLKKSNYVNDDTKNIIIKIYDHIQLANTQIENTSNIFENNIIETKDKLHNEIKEIEKEYITILGIFASIVLSFVGGITFTTSVLQNIDKSNIYRLLLIIIIIAGTLLNSLYVLISFILRINEKEKSYDRKFIKYCNITLLVITILIVFAWFFNILDFRVYISNNLYWTKQ